MPRRLLEWEHVAFEGSAKKDSEFYNPEIIELWSKDLEKKPYVYTLADSQTRMRIRNKQILTYTAVSLQPSLLRNWIVQIGRHTVWSIVMAQENFFRGFVTQNTRVIIKGDLEIHTRDRDLVKLIKERQKEITGEKQAPGDVFSFDNGGERLVHIDDV